MKFETNVCPLCDKVLRLRKIAGVTVYQCDTFIDYEGPTGPYSKYHYEVEVDANMSIQHIYVGCWGIDNYSNATRSRIHKACERNGTVGWKLVTELPYIRPEAADVLLARVNKLMNFL